ncbi:hypothetical protein [Parafrankia sp. FMc2]|uniref:hypothetical protein n=1 Tax=Parafrankia sp. FMc2 TaxID=3233196 RepID=UPI0034D4F513
MLLVPWGANGRAIVVQAGSDSVDLSRVLAELPAGLEFSESYGDVDVILVYRAPGAPFPGPKPGGPDDILSSGRRRAAETRTHRCVRTR